MCAQKSNISSNRASSKQDDSINLREIFVKYIYYWPFFILGILLAMAAAFAYQHVANPVYEIKATMIMQDSKESSNNSSEATALQELNLTNPPKNVENEIEVLQSRHLVETVVNDLQLWVGYGLQRKTRTEDIYNTTPIKIRFLETSGDISNQKMFIEIKDGGSFSLKTSDTESKDFLFTDTIKNRLGIWQLDPTPNIKNFVGLTICISLSDPSATADAYQDALDVVLKDKLASAVEISIKDKIPERGQDFVNRLITFYNQAEIAEKNRITKSTLAFINKRLDSLTLELNHAEEQVENFRSSRGLTDIGAQSQVFLQNEQSNDTRLNDVKVQLDVISGIENYINSSNSTDKKVPSTLNISDPGLIALVQRFEEQQQERSRLLATTPEKNPLFDPLNKQIATTKAAIKENIQNIKTSLLTTQRQLQTFGSGFKASIQDIPGEERQLTNLKRQQLIKENLYTYLLQKREEVSLSYASTLSNARLVDMAYTVPLKASKKFVPFIIAFIIGLLFPAVLIYARDIFRNKITTRKEIEDGTSVPVAAEFNFTKLKTPIVFDPRNDKVNADLVEQFRSLRTQLHYLHNNESRGRITLIASSMANEGKSFIAANLGVALATSGKKTIILELNLYNPTLYKIFNLPPQNAGMSNYLNWASLKEEVIQNSVTYRNLDMITTGPFIANFSELLDRKRIELLFDWLRLNYDHIIIDTAPVHALSDVNIVSRLCDITLFIIRQDYTSKTLLPYIKKQYEDQQLPKMSIVFNGLTKRFR
jgi:tyrosine-protein kinase Etk/Wzc